MDYFKLYWGVVILLLPLWIRTEKIPLDMRFAKDMFFVTSVFISILIFGNKKIKHRPTLYPLVYLMFISAINQYFIISTAVIFQWIWVSLALICFSQFYSNIKPQDKNFYLNILSIAAIIQTIWVIFDSFGAEPYRHILNLYPSNNVNSTYKGGGLRITGSLGNSMVCSTFIAITGLSLLRKKWIYFTPIISYAIYLTKSSTGALALSMGILTYFLLKIFKNKNIAFSFMILSFNFLGLIVYFFRDKFLFLNDNGRFEVWRQSITMFDGFDIIYGKGLGYVHDNFSKMFLHTEIFRHLHNEFLEIILAYGIIGIVLFCIMIFTMIKRENNITILSMVIGYLVTMSTSLTLHISATALIGILLVALCLIQGEQNGINNRSSWPKRYKSWRSKIKNYRMHIHRGNGWRS